MGETATAPAEVGACPPPGFALGGEVAGFGLCRATPESLPGLRKRPGPIPEGWGRVPPSLLRYSDEQSIVGVGAVLTAIERMESHPTRFEDWGVVAASRYIGRSSLALALRRFDAEGVWGVSPHLIPHFALHSPAGTISLALGLHGPNLGVGGGLHSSAEGVLAALSWLELGVVPGVWLVLSGWSPELRPSPEGGLASPSAECQALALALVADHDEGRTRLRIVARAEGPEIAAPVDLVRLAEDLDRCESSNPIPMPMPMPWTIATDPTARLRVELLPGRIEDEA